MNIVTLALKDLRLILRDKMGAFFILGFPVLLGVFFGLIFGGTSQSSRGKMNVAIIDLDRSDWSRQFVDELARNDGILLEDDQLESARETVRRGERVGLVVIPKGFGESAGIMWQEQPEIQVGLDPSRAAESAMLEGFLMQASGALIGKRFQDPSQFLPSIKTARDELLDSPDMDPAAQLLGKTFLDSLLSMLEAADRWQRASERNTQENNFQIQFANIQRIDITQQIEANSVRGQMRKIRSRWDISFPQAMLWGIMSCAAGFAGSIAREETRGTLLRLRTAPLTKLEILLGKALACLIACLIVIALMTALGIALGMRSDSYSKLAASSLVVSLGYVGIMMAMSVLGKTEESVTGSGMAINLVMAMLGGAMVPVMFMPGFIQSLSVISPVHWSIRLIEGSIWRQFSWFEMIVPTLILLAIGFAGLLIGTTILVRRYR
jgi:ABC-2 type transport system permease protein